MRKLSYWSGIRRTEATRGYRLQTARLAIGMYPVAYGNEKYVSLSIVIVEVLIYPYLTPDSPSGDD